ncbi:hypothetical protein IFM89_035074 [Coptis chinensis]|uniref:DUF4378 domain-containing protein n=1 Tax=Coptis chinensis TaxID=261450 RepID=A0A835IIT4_9MAGN|nr:hypothetical protein IFM89_035074 [Coptis chinensis]
MEMERKLRKPTPKPAAMLKEYLRDDFSSCSSSGFRSFPRQSCYASVRTLLDMDLKNSRKLLPQTRPKQAKTTKITAFQKASIAVINIVKHFQFSQKQKMLPRSISRRLKRSFTKKADREIKRENSVVIKVKDILRWRSFTDEEKQKPLECTASSPVQTTITTMTTTTTSSNSWSDSDFTEFLLSSCGSSECSGENEVDECKKDLLEKKKISKRKCNEVVEDSMEKCHGDSEFKDNDQFSPVSVLGFPFEEDEDSSSSFQSSLESMERTKHKLMQKIQRFESLAKIEPLDLNKRIASLELEDSFECPSDSQSNSVNNDEKVDQEENEEYIKTEERARELLRLTNETSGKYSDKDTADGLLMDFFRDEIMEGKRAKKTSKGDECDKEFLKVATDWMNGNNALMDWRVEESRGVHVKEMERGGMWRQSEEEKGELALEMEIRILNSLMDGLLFDLLS